MLTKMTEINITVFALNSIKKLSNSCSRTMIGLS